MRVRWLLGALPLLAVYACGGGESSPLDPKASADGAGEGNAPGDTLPDGAPTGDAAGGDSAADEDAGATSPYVHRDVNHVLTTGQSNAVAHDSLPFLTSTQPYGNLMFNPGVMTSGNCNGSGCPSANYVAPTSLVPLVEGDHFFGPTNRVETSASGMANLATRLAAEQHGFGGAGKPAQHDMLVSNHGRSGNTYWCLRKDGCSYKPASQLKAFTEAMMQVEAGKALAAAAGKSYVVRAVTTIHGESNHYAYSGAPANWEFPIAGTDGTPNAIQDYGDGLVEWQRDYEASIKAITGQTEPVPLLVSGIAGWTNTEHSRIPQMQLDGHTKAPGKVLLIGPTYMLPHAGDCLHLSNHGSRRLGEYFAKVYAKVVLGGEAWEPVRPKQITRAGAVVTVRYHVPAPPLVLDTTRVTNPGSHGFKVVQGGATLPISSVAVTAPDTVTITLASAPAGAGVRLWYGMAVIDGNQCIGPTNGPRGNLRDSDQTPSNHGYDLHNWGVQFDLAVP
jgi:hypothetical protein